MKKIFLTIILAAAAMNINAQLVVDSIGQVGIGTETPKSQLSVGGNGNNSTSFYCNAQSKNRGMTIINNSDTTSVTYGFILVFRTIRAIVLVEEVSQKEIISLNHLSA